jgi:AcrR family transcriptional regulator
VNGVSKPFASVWTREPRRPKTAGLRREQIVAAAVELADAEGLESLSMRKLGARLGAGATSLYWYVANKDELLELVLDEIWGLVDTPEPEQSPWREVVGTVAYSLRATLLAHPWVATLLGQMPSVGPRAFELGDRLRRTFLRAGFTGADIYLAAGTVMSFVLGQVIPEISLSKAADPEEASYVESLDHLARDYPEMLHDYRSTLPADPDVARALAFDFGLLCVLDGLEARLRGPRSASGG